MATRKPLTDWSKGDLHLELRRMHETSTYISSPNDLYAELNRRTTARYALWSTIAASRAR